MDASSQLQLDTPASKVATSWRLLTRLELIEQWLKTHHAISFKHIRRTANKVADFLANKGVTQSFSLYKGSFSNTNDVTLIHDFTHLVHKDSSILDVCG